MRLAAGADVVHAHGHQAAVVAAVAVARARPRPRLVVSLHNDLPPGTRRPARAVVGWAVRRADLVTGASPDLVELARALGARRVEPADVASPRTASLLTAEALADDERAELLASAGVPTDRPVVLAVSRVAPQKQLGTLVDAAAASGELATWVVVGDGDPQLRRELEQRADRTGAAVRFVGARDDVDRWLRSADVFVLTSRWEARALVVQEAMAAALPVVVPRTGGLPGLVGDAGVLVPVGDAAALAAQVDRLLADPAARNALGLAARVEAGRWATPADEARRWDERYTELLRG
jgi:glycosyltransferase involved in cell wall biosynthesis